MMKLILLSFLFISTFSFSQNPSFEWVNQIEGVGDHVGNSIKTDSNGDVLVVGEFEGTVDFDPGVGITNLTSNGGLDIFIQKLSSNGDLVWVKQIGEVHDDYAGSVTVDFSNNVYVTGRFRGDVDFDPGIGVNNLFVQFSDDSYVLKLDSSGDFSWAHQFGDPSAGARGESLTIDNSGDLLVTGFFGGTVDFDPSAATVNFSANGTDVFILKLDTNGNFVWVKQVGGAGQDVGSSIVIDLLDNVFVAGSFQQTTDFDPGVGISDLTSFGNSDGFILKLDENGIYQWSEQIGGTGYDGYSSADIDPNGDLLLTGTFQGSADLDPGLTVLNFTSNGGVDMFIQKVTPSGIMTWVKHIGGAGGDLGNAITSDVTGDIYVTGQFYQLVDFDPGPGVNIMTASLVDGFILKLNPTGEFIWTGQMEGTSISSGFSITLDDIKSIYSTGRFQQTVDFDPGPNQANLTNPSGYDGFVQKLSQCQPTSGTDVQSACDSYTWIDGNTYTTDNNSATFLETNAAGCDSLVTLDLTMTYSNTGTDVQSACDSYTWIDGNSYTSSNNTATWIETNAAGCDSLVTLDLTIIPLPDNNVTQTGSLLEADQVGATYQWLDCNDNNAIISGEINQAYTPVPVTGNYAVEITFNGCVDTSSCFVVDYTGIDENGNLLFSLYPNPTESGEFTVDIEGGIKSIEVSDLTGRKIDLPINLQDGTVDGSRLESGKYIVRVRTNQDEILQREVVVIK